MSYAEPEVLRSWAGIGILLVGLLHDVCVCVGVFVRECVCEGVCM